MNPKLIFNLPTTQQNVRSLLVSSKLRQNKTLHIIGFRSLDSVVMLLCPVEGFVACPVLLISFNWFCHGFCLLSPLLGPSMGRVPIVGHIMCVFLSLLQYSNYFTWSEKLHCAGILWPLQRNVYPMLLRFSEGGVKSLLNQISLTATLKYVFRRTKVKQLGNLPCLMNRVVKSQLCKQNTSLQGLDCNI